jgi:hypothetical protein
MEDHKGRPMRMPIYSLGLGMLSWPSWLKALDLRSP